MIRNIVQIDEEKCIGCGLCAKACKESAIEIVDGKARLIRDDYCDGLGNCLPACPVDAISIVQREAEPFNAETTKEKKKVKVADLSGGCPGRRAATINRAYVQAAAPVTIGATPMESMLSQWPVQIKLAPVNAPFFSHANLLIAADCTAFAYANFHQDFIRRHVTLIGCPKLDEGDYTEKLTEILKNNDIRSVKIVRMEVPCCGGLENAVKEALIRSGKMIPWQIVVITTDGRILEE